MLADMPTYAQQDSVITALLNAVGLELQRIDDYLAEVREASFPLTVSGDYLVYWERFLDLPVQPEGVTDERRQQTIRAAIARRSAGAGAGWYDLLSSVIAPATFRHAENSDFTGAYAPYELSFSNIGVQNRAVTEVNGTQTSLPPTNATLTVDSTTGFALSGTIFVGGNPVTFTGSTATTFTGVSGLPSTVTNNTPVIQRADYRSGIFFDMAHRTNPAHIEISEIEIAGDDTFRVGISEVGDEI